MTLRPKQQRFRDEYLIDLNATQAAIRAGYSKATAYSQGQRLLKNVEIAASIDEARAKLSEKTEITLESLTDMLKVAYDMAERQESGSAMTQAAMGIAKLHGLEADPRKNEREPLTVNIDGFPDLKRKPNGHANGHANGHDSE